eukprot:GHVU01109666.1.p1 GENE.GHVU01109666.1~~GHVU01109666.1.p1  ORF type:complete len:188 (+),score=19.09 GHVU01109666.1:85-648(+)
MHTYSCKLEPLYPEKVLTLTLFSPVRNAEELAKYAMNANCGNEAPRVRAFHLFIDAKMIISATHVALAIIRALRAEESGLMKTRALHTEVLYQLSTTTNISESLSTYGLTGSTDAIVLATIDASTEEAELLSEMIQGEKTLSIESLSTAPSAEMLKAVKCSAEEASLSGGVEAAVIFRAAIKSVAQR